MQNAIVIEHLVMLTEQLVLLLALLISLFSHFYPIFNLLLLFKFISLFDKFF